MAELYGISLNAGFSHTGKSKSIVLAQLHKNYKYGLKIYIYKIYFIIRRQESEASDNMKRISSG